ncbi:WD40 repeat domain-containing protein [Actinoplanes regularis]|uniref:WD40 repeat domain-containing protein n=1 Tax=Actinoplanes regularis TaxID=52697 RepID=UPI0024A1FEC8|nr:WD40 repeat domain-containing protein [Actinoplanes regularis]GLW31063.1 hypothetical protein Areg01_40030 [Actinoplanes regularis]
MDRYEQMAALLRQGRTAAAEQLHAADPHAWLPRWTAADPLSPALRQVHQLHNSIIAARLDDTSAWAVTGRHIFRIDRADGQVGRIRLEGDDAYRPDAAFHGDTAVVIEDERLLVFDVATGKLLLTTDPDDIPRRAGNLVSLGVSGDIAVTGTTNGYLLQWSLTDGRLLARTAAHDGFVTCVAISPDGPPAVLSLGGHPRCTLAFHDLDGLRRTAEAEMPCDTSVGAWTRLDGERRAITVDEEGELTVSDPATATALARYATSGSSMTPVVHDDGAQVILGTDFALQILDLRDGTVRGTVRTDFTCGISHAAAHGTGIFAVQGMSTEGRTNLFEVADPPPRDAVGRSRLLKAVAAVIDGREVVVALSEDGLRHMYDMADGQPLTAPLGEPTREYGYVGGHPCLAIDGRARLAVMNHLAPVVIDLSTGQTRRASTTLPDESILWGLAIHDRVLAALTIGGTLAVWDADTLTLRAHTRIGDSADATTIALTDLDGRSVLLAGYQSGAIRWFDTGDLTEITPPGALAGRTVASHVDVDSFYDRHGPDAVRILHITGGVLVAAAGATVTCYDLRTGEPAGPPLEHPGRVLGCCPTTIAGSPAVATSCDDDTLRIWDVATGRTIRSIGAPRNASALLGATANQIVVRDRGHLIAVGPYPASRSQAS